MTSLRFSLAICFAAKIVSFPCWKRNSNWLHISYVSREIFTIHKTNLFIQPYEVPIAFWITKMSDSKIMYVLGIRVYPMHCCNLCASVYVHTQQQQQQQLQRRIEPQVIHIRGKIHRHSAHCQVYFYSVKCYRDNFNFWAIKFSFRIPFALQHHNFFYDFKLRSHFPWKKRHFRNYLIFLCSQFNCSEEILSDISKFELIQTEFHK